ncbi:nascent polypeptide-associated complex subunit alpha, muscle-specific form-like [Lutra lutra]|uniref:nascent polypeptide-associated complex subunit alpha, muscle-specific form-like n=1 Tax=Lutra lutra TaxID=9657 RepID=UPI001FD3A5D1|nr:nascent polypeptide-associated complex subunit alpha, muscle-specific form-like [Lutra lutra]
MRLLMDNAPGHPRALMEMDRETSPLPHTKHSESPADRRPPPPPRAAPRPPRPGPRAPPAQTTGAALTPVTPTGARLRTRGTRPRASRSHLEVPPNSSRAQGSGGRLPRTPSSRQRTRADSRPARAADRGADRKVCGRLFLPPDAPGPGPAPRRPRPGPAPRRRPGPAPRRPRPRCSADVVARLRVALPRPRPTPAAAPPLRQCTRFAPRSPSPSPAPPLTSGPRSELALPGPRLTLPAPGRGPAPSLTSRPDSALAVSRLLPKPTAPRPRPGPSADVRSPLSDYPHQAPPHAGRIPALAPPRRSVQCRLQYRPPQAPPHTPRVGHWGRASVCAAGVAPRPARPAFPAAPPRALPRDAGPGSARPPHPVARWLPGRPAPPAPALGTLPTRVRSSPDTRLPTAVLPRPGPACGSPGPPVRSLRRRGHDPTRERRVLRGPQTRSPAVPARAIPPQTQRLGGRRPRSISARRVGGETRRAAQRESRGDASEAERGGEVGGATGWSRGRARGPWMLRDGPGCPAALAPALGGTRAAHSRVLLRTRRSPRCLGARGTSAAPRPTPASRASRAGSPLGSGVPPAPELTEEVLQGVRYHGHMDAHSGLPGQTLVVVGLVPAENISRDSGQSRPSPRLVRGDEGGARLD